MGKYVGTTLSAEGGSAFGGVVVLGVSGCANV